jgi:hypothetical protein
VQVDEASAPQQTIELRGPRGVPAREPPKRRRLVVLEVVHVHRGIARPGRHQEIHHGLECGPLLDVGVRPPAAILPVRPDAEQVLASALACEAGRLEVEEDVARRRQRQAIEADARSLGVVIPVGGLR